MQHAAPSNVAYNTNAALAAFLPKKAKSVVAAPKVARLHTKNAIPDPGVHLENDADEDGFHIVTNFEGSTLVETEKTPAAASKGPSELTASQQDMPPPPPIASTARDPQRASTTFVAIKPVENEELAENHAASAAFASQLKRLGDDAGLDEPASKRQQVDPTTRPQRAHQTTSPKLSHTANRTGSKRQVNQSQADVEIDDSRPAPRKPTRYASRDSIDIHGSPIPKDLVVPENSTALEAFSQQAALSSDGLLSGLANAQSKGVGSLRFQTTSTVLPPPSRQPEALSSNSKARPASPHEDSQAVSEHVTEQDAHDRVLLGVWGQEARTDPFTSSESARKQPGRRGVLSELQAALQAITSEIVTEGPRFQAAKQIDEDPEKTLVEPEIDPPRPKKVAGLPSDDFSDTSEDPDEEASMMRDVGVWRNALQPHQMNLFDELVNVSHRLVAHLVDQETAARNAVEDYRRRGERIVEVMEQSRAQMYQQSAKLLKERKKRLRKHLTQTGNKLKDCAAAVTETKEDRTKQRKAFGLASERLDGLLAEYL